MMKFDSDIWTIPNWDMTSFQIWTGDIHYFSNRAIEIIFNSLCSTRWRFDPLGKKNGRPLQGLKIADPPPPLFPPSPSFLFDNSLTTKNYQQPKNEKKTIIIQCL